MVDPGLLQAFREAEREHRMRGGEPGDDSWQALSSIPQVLAYLTHLARSWGCSEAEAADLVELTVMDIDFDRDELRGFARLLAALRYDAVAARLMQLAKSAKRLPKRVVRRRPKPARRDGSKSDTVSHLGLKAKPGRCESERPELKS